MFQSHLSAKAYKSWPPPTDIGRLAMRNTLPFPTFLIGVRHGQCAEGVPMALGDIMTARIVTVEMDDRLEVVKEIFDTVNFHHLLVLDENKKLGGIVSDRDLLRALSPYVGSAAETARDLATLNKRVHQIMTRHPITLRPESGISEAVNLLLMHGISCIPIVDDKLKPVGIVSWRDLLKSLATS
jgi:acetoin utilization protein AcuB